MFVYSFFVFCLFFVFVLFCFVLFCFVVVVVVVCVCVCVCVSVCVCARARARARVRVCLAFFFVFFSPVYVTLLPQCCNFHSISFDLRNVQTKSVLQVKRNIAKVEALIKESCVSRKYVMIFKHLFPDLLNFVTKN